jgi:hypothetical protein
MSVACFILPNGKIIGFYRIPIRNQKIIKTFSFEIGKNSFQDYIKDYENIGSFDK